MPFNVESESINRIEKSLDQPVDTIISALARQIYDAVYASGVVFYDFDVWVMSDEEDSYLLEYSYDQYSTSLMEGALPISVGDIVSTTSFVQTILDTINSYSPA